MLFWAPDCAANLSKAALCFPLMSLTRNSNAVHTEKELSDPFLPD